MCSSILLPFSCLFRWAQEFLNEENKGLDVLVDYLSFAQRAVTYVHTESQIKKRNVTSQYDKASGKGTCYD